MSYSKPQELVHVKQLIDNFELNEAGQLIKRFEEEAGHTQYDLISCHLLKCKLLSIRGLHEEIVKITEETYKKSLELGKIILSVDSLLIMAEALLSLDEIDEAQKIIKEGDPIDEAQKIIIEGAELLKTLKSELVEAEYKQRKAYIAWLKGMVYFAKLDSDLAIKKYKLSLSLREELGHKTEIAQSLYSIARVFIGQKKNHELSSKYFEHGLTIAEESGHKGVIGYTLYYMGLLYRVKGEVDHRITVSERALANFHDIKNKFMEARVLATLGESFAIKGELNLSIKFFEQSLELSKEIGYKWAIADAFASLSFCYHMIGDLERALECIEQAMELNHEQGFLYWLALNYDILIPILIDKGDLERARNSLRDFEQLNRQLKRKFIGRHNFLYLLDKALVLKTSPRARDRGMAEEILKNLLKDQAFFYEDRLIALVNLCDLLLKDFQITNQVEILEEIKPLIEQLLVLSEKSHSFWILGETYLLQAKLALLNFEMKGARRLLTQAQKIAESYGIKRLAIQISHEHDELLKQIKIWESLKDSEASLSERMELAHLKEQMERMVQKRKIVIPKLSDEQPVLLLIISEGGRPIFSQSFTEDQTFKDHLFGGFFTAINSFINEMFSEGLDRAIFGKYTLLMSSVSPFFMCYVFKGQSYSAQQRIKLFIKELQDDKQVWQTFRDSHRLSREIQLTDIPSLKPLINKIFLEKLISKI